MSDAAVKILEILGLSAQEISEAVSLPIKEVEAYLKRIGKAGDEMPMRFIKDLAYVTGVHRENLMDPDFTHSPPFPVLSTTPERVEADGYYGAVDLMLPGAKMRFPVRQTEAARFWAPVPDEPITLLTMTNLAVIIVPAGVDEFTIVDKTLAPNPMKILEEGATSIAPPEIYLSAFEMVCFEKGLTDVDPSETMSEGLLSDVEGFLLFQNSVSCSLTDFCEKLVKNEEPLICEKRIASLS